MDDNKKWFYSYHPFLCYAILSYSIRSGFLLFVYEFISIKFEFESSPATTMAADQELHEVPSSLSAKVVGYVGSSF